MEPLGRKAIGPLSRGAPVLVSLQGRGPLNQRLYRGLRQSILEGKLAPGTRLPSSRSLADDLGLSRNVVLMAFDKLLDEGYVEARTGSGTYVSQLLPDAALAPWRPRLESRTASQPIRLSAQARRVVALAPLPAPTAPLKPGLRYEFRYGLPAIADFPADAWSRVITRRARTVRLSTLRYGRALGYRPLREAIAQYVTRARGVVATPDQVIVINGSQQALDLVSRLLLDPGDDVVVEEPCYLGARHVFLGAGARLCPVKVDEAGLDVDRLPRRGSIRLAYVTPSHQFPLGGVMPLARRLELLRWAEETGAYVLEDDYDSEFRYEGRPVEAVQGLDRSGRVLYVGTFSKVLFPSLRIGYLIVPPAMVSAVAAMKFLIDMQTPTFEQEALADFIVEGHFERHLRRSRARNAARRATLLAALDRHFGDRVEVAGANAGVHVVVWLRGVDQARLEAIRRRAADKGVGIYSVAPHYLRAPRRAGLLFGYACLSERDIKDGIAVLSGVLR
jgi:GntR family transcriptional regulator / MocR family aminotransferase